MNPKRFSDARCIFSRQNRSKLGSTAYWVVGMNSAEIAHNMSILPFIRLQFWFKTSPLCKFFGQFCATADTKRSCLAADQRRTCCAWHQRRFFFIGGLFYSFAVFFGFCLTVHASNPLPANRTPGGTGGWYGLVGIPGGIPTRTNIYASFSPGATYTQVQNALNSCPSNGVVYLAAGTYDFESELNIANNGVTLRGATNQWGQPATIITNNSTCILLIGSCCGWYNDFTAPQASWFHPWTNNYAQGTTTISVSNTSTLAPGQLVYLDQLNDPDTTAYSPANPDGPYVTGEYSSLAHPNQGYDRIQFQVNVIQSISGSSVTLAAPIYMPNWSATYQPELWTLPSKDGPVTTMSGVENISFETPSGDDTVQIEYTKYCWVLNCWASFGQTAHIGYFYMTQSFRPEIRHCYMHDKGTADRYGIHTRVVAGALITDNIMAAHGTMLMVNGVSGSVYSYNYAYTNIDQAVGGFATAGILTHGGTPNMDLIEGNEAPQLQLDSQWQNSSYMVAFRDRFPGHYAPAASIGNIQAMDALNTNYHASVIGCVLGRPGIDVNYEVSGNNNTSPGCNDGSRVFYFGYQTAGNGCNSAFDARVTNTLIRAVNWTSATFTNNGVDLGGYTANDLPASYYLTSPPANWGNLPWPGIDPMRGPIPDLATNISPAAYRMNVSFVNGGPGLDPPAAGGQSSPPPSFLSIPMGWVVGPTNGPVPTTVNFGYSGPGETNCVLEFGDGTSASIANTNLIVHTYSTVGVYQVFTHLIQPGGATYNRTNLGYTITVTNAP